MDKSSYDRLTDQEFIILAYHIYRKGESTENLTYRETRAESKQINWNLGIPNRHNQIIKTIYAKNNIYV